MYPHPHLCLLFPSPEIFCFTFSRAGGEISSFSANDRGNCFAEWRWVRILERWGLTAFSADFKVVLLCLAPTFNLSSRITWCHRFLSLMGDFAEQIRLFLGFSHCWLRIPHLRCAGTQHMACCPSAFHLLKVCYSYLFSFVFLFFR